MLEESEQGGTDSIGWDCMAVLHDTATRPRHAPCRTRVSELFLAQNELVSTDTATPCPFDTRVRHGCEPCRLFWCRVRATLLHGMLKDATTHVLRLVTARPRLCGSSCECTMVNCQQAWWLYRVYAMQQLISGARASALGEADHFSLYELMRQKGIRAGTHS